MVAFDSILPYYDNRKAVVTSHHDDYPTSGFAQAMDVHQLFKLWMGVAVMTNSCTPSTWQALQDQINEGFIEAVSHSRSHAHLPYDYESEIGGSKQAILDNLSLPFGQYVYCYIEPYSETNDAVYAKCAEKRYFVEGMSSGFAYSPPCVIVPFDKEKNMFVRQEACSYAEYDDLATMNAKFDAVYNAGGLYWYRTHPAGQDWSPSGKMYQHFQHISDKKDVWYAPLGCIYLTQYAIVKSLLSVSTVPYPPSSIDSYLLQHKTSDDYFNDIEYIRQDGSILYVGVHFRGTREIHLQFVNAGTIFKVTIPSDEWSNYGFQYPLTLKFTGVGANEDVRKYTTPTEELPTVKACSDVGKAWGFRRWNLQDSRWR